MTGFNPRYQNVTPSSSSSSQTQGAAGASTASTVPPAIDGAENSTATLFSGNTQQSTASHGSSASAGTSAPMLE